MVSSGSIPVAVWFILQAHKSLVTHMASRKVPVISKGCMQLPILAAPLLLPALSYSSLFRVYTGLPRWLSGKEPACQPLGREDPLEGKGQPTPGSLPGEFHGQRRLAGYNP